MNKKNLTLMMLGAMFSASMMNAQTTPIKKDSVKHIEEIYVRGQSLKTKNSTSKVNVITNDEIKNMVVEQPLRILEQVPGVNVIAYGQGGVADQFSMRGFAGGGHGGQAGVEIDGISLNEAEGHSDGYADLNILIPLNLKKVSVYKGPSSALHGRFGQGGTVSLETRKGGNYQDLRLSAGSYNTFDAQYAHGSMMKLGGIEDALKANFAIQFFTTDGYIKNSNILKGNFSGRIAHQFSPKSEIAVSFIGHKSEWNAPGYIPKDQYEDKTMRNKPHFTAENDGGRKSFLSERIDFSHKITEDIKLLVFGYALQQDFTRYAKFRYEPTGQSGRFNTRDVFAFGGSLNGNTRLVEKNFDWIAGLEYYTEKTERERYNTSHRRRLNKTQERVFDVQTFSAYAQGEWQLDRFFKPSVGLRFDTFGGNYKNSDPGQTPINGQIKSLSHFSPKLGFRSTLLNNFDFHANVSNGFSLPGDDYSELKFEDRAKPIELWQYEAGFSYNNNKNFSFDITGFILNSSREIIVDPNNPGELINAGKTHRAGIEADTRATISENLLLKGSFTYTHTKIVEGENKGKALTQLPKTMFNLGAVYTSPMGFGADVQFRRLSDYFTTGDNLNQGGGYNLVNLKVFYNFDKLFSTKGNVFFAVNNLLDEHYAETIFGTSLYSASPTRNFTIGVNYSF
ncbi:MAG: TonB-dependent receptor [Flavobacteriaceae bacterium]|nr:TonB-dependent receptor [Flavobacteriaceae bacterium]